MWRPGRGFRGKAGGLLGCEERERERSSNPGLEATQLLLSSLRKYIRHGGTRM